MFDLIEIRKCNHAHYSLFLLYVIYSNLKLSNTAGIPLCSALKSEKKPMAGTAPSIVHVCPCFCPPASVQPRTYVLVLGSSYKYINNRTFDGESRAAAAASIRKVICSHFFHPDRRRMDIPNNHTCPVARIVIRRQDKGRP